MLCGHSQIAEDCVICNPALYIGLCPIHGPLTKDQIGGLEEEEECFDNEFYDGPGRCLLGREDLDEDLDMIECNAPCTGLWALKALTALHRVEELERELKLAQEGEVEAMGICGHDRIAERCSLCGEGHPVDDKPRPYEEFAERCRLGDERYELSAAVAMAGKEPAFEGAEPYDLKLQKLLEVVRGLVYFQDGNGTTLYDLQAALEDLEGQR
jgi:hypothetical protein